jgi:hypothetical protein
MKQWVITPAFCKAKLLEGQLAHLDTVMDRERHHQVIIDQHYPVDKERNREEIRELAAKYKCTLVDSGGDLGLHHGFNNATIKQLNIPSEDFVIGCDPDDRPSNGFVDHFTRVLVSDPKMAAICATFWVIDMRYTEGVFKNREETIDGLRVWIHPGVEMFNVVGFNWNWLKSVGGFSQPNNFYGGLEMHLHRKWTEKKMRYGYLPSVRSDAQFIDRGDATLFDPEYRQYKDAHLAGFTGSFEAWLKKEGKF